jgi:hypothetical protein
MAAAIPTAEGRCPGLDAGEARHAYKSTPDETCAEATVDPRVSTAVADLAARLAIDQSQIQLVLFEAVTWPDPSLGCPQPGMRYRQIPVDGYRILLRAADRLYAYHGGDQRGPFYCEHPALHPAEPGEPRPDT